MTNFDRYLADELQDPEFRALYGAAHAKSELAVALGNAITAAGITPRMYHWLLLGEANPKIGTLGRWLAALGWGMKITIEPLEGER